jgi:hypothetical protein
VIDESSTLSYSIFHSVLKELKPHRIYLFGDEKQLPPILGQHLLADLLACNNSRGFTSRLETIHRNKGELASKMWKCDTEDAIKEWINDLKHCPSVTW